MADRLTDVGLPGLAVAPRSLRRDIIRSIGRSEKARQPNVGEVDDALLRLRKVLLDYHGALTRVDPQYLELFAMRDASRAQILLKLRLPGAVPYLVTGAKIASGLAVIGAIVGEFFAGYGAAGFGLGYLIVQSSGQLKTAELFAAIFACTLLGLLLFAAVSLLGELVLRRWRGRELEA